MFIAIRCSKFILGLSKTEKVELTEVLYLFLCCKPNIHDLIHTALITIKRKNVLKNTKLS